MAVTIQTSPNNYTPSDNPLSYTFSSTQTGQANFSFKVEIILNGATVSEDRVFVGSGTYGHYDASPIVKNLMQSPRVTTALNTSMDIISTLALKVTEIYGTTPIAVGTVTSSDIFTFKASLAPKEWEDSDFVADYLNTKWLTDTPNNTFRVIRGQDALCAMLISTNKKIEFKFYDSSDILLDTYDITLNYRYWQVNASSSNLTAVYGGVDYNDVAYFTINIDTSELLTFIYVDEYCNDIHELVWLNKYGTYDQYPIEHNVSEESDIETRSFRKKYGAWNGTAFGYDSNSSGSIDFEKTITDKGSLVTNYMTDTVQNWFVSAYDSPEQYLYNPIGLLFRLNLTDRSYKNKQGRFDELIMEEMKYSRTMTRSTIKL